MGGYFDDPNRQAVGLEPAWAEGSGGSDTSAGGGPPPGSDPANMSLDDMSKDELLAKAQELGVTPANHGMTKEELRAGIDEHQATVA